MGEVNVPGLLGLIVFYFIILFAGIFSQKCLGIINRKRKPGKEAESSKLTETEDMMLAGRDINYFVGIFTMTATWVGGGYINGAAEATIAYGLLWCQAPFCYAISLLCGGLFFAKKMREMEFITMLDPFQIKYGQRLGALFYIPAFSGEILWSASILAALGTSLQVICGIPEVPSILVSAGFACIYTLFGGLYSVSFTDVIQLICIFVGLILSIPFMTHSEFVNDPLQANPMFNGKEQRILGEIKQEHALKWCDHAIMMMCGGIPWQAYFQRVLSSRNASVAKVLSMSAALGCFCAAIPSVIIGWITINTDWAATGWGKDLETFKLAVPLCLMYLCPAAISFIGLGAVSAAVMSSTDSSILGVSCMFTRNVISRVIWPSASDRQLKWALRGTILINTAIASIIAITVKSVYGLYTICSDLVFILLFPHLLLTMHAPTKVNRYGMVIGFTVCILLRVLSGEPVLKYEAPMRWPMYEEGKDGKVGVQLFPFRTVIMLIHLILALGCTFISQQLNKRGWLVGKCDVLNEFDGNDRNQGLILENRLAVQNVKPAKE